MSGNRKKKMKQRNVGKPVKPTPSALRPLAVQSTLRLNQAEPNDPDDYQDGPLFISGAMIRAEREDTRPRHYIQMSADREAVLTAIKAAPKDHRIALIHEDGFKETGQVPWTDDAKKEAGQLCADLRSQGVAGIQVHRGCGTPNIVMRGDKFLPHEELRREFEENRDLLSRAAQVWGTVQECRCCILFPFPEFKEDDPYFPNLILPEEGRTEKTVADSCLDLKNRGVVRLTAYWPGIVTFHLADNSQEPRQLGVSTITYDAIEGSVHRFGTRRPDEEKTSDVDIDILITNDESKTDWSGFS